MKHQSLLLRAVIPAAATIAFASMTATAVRADAELHALPSSNSVETDAQRALVGRKPGTLDTTAPFLLGLAVSGSVNAQAPNQSIHVDLDIKDDISGVAFYYFEVTSPSGKQYITRFKDVVSPLLHVTPTLTVGSYPFSEPGFTVFDEPGMWQLSFLEIQDAAHNYRTYGLAELQGYGNTAFTVTNTGGFDNTPPTLASGTIDTPTIRRSKPPKGLPAGTPPYVSADLSVTDAGSGAISGNAQVYMTLCHLNASQACDDYLDLSGTTNQAGGQANTVTAGSQMRADQTLGQYVIYYVDVYDVAGNVVSYQNAQLGGSTNFATYFPQGATIFINQ